MLTIESLKANRKQQLDREVKKEQEVSLTRLRNALGDALNECKIGIIDEDPVLYYPSHRPIVVKFNIHKDSRGESVSPVFFVKRSIDVQFNTFADALIYAEIKQKPWRKKLALLTKRAKQYFDKIYKKLHNLYLYLLE